MLSNSFLPSWKKIEVSELTKKRFLPANPANGADAVLRTSSLDIFDLDFNARGIVVIDKIDTFFKDLYKIYRLGRGLRDWRRN